MTVDYQLTPHPQRIAIAWSVACEAEQDADRAEIRAVAYDARGDSERAAEERAERDARLAARDSFRELLEQRLADARADGWTVEPDPAGGYTGTPPAAADGDGQ